MRQQRQQRPTTVPGTRGLLLLLVFVTIQQHHRDHHHNTCHGFVPPRPGSDLEAVYEPVHVYRRKHNITFRYVPEALHPESCRYLTETECRAADESMLHHQSNHRNIQKRFRNRRRSRNLQTVEQQQQEEEEQQANKLRGVASSSTGSPQQEQEQEHGEQAGQEEELQYHMAQFRKALGEFTLYYEQQQQQQQQYEPTRQEELEELAQLLRERNETLDEAHESLLREYQAKNADRNGNATSATSRQLEREEQAAVTGRNPRVGTFNVLLLLMRFSDHVSRTLPSKYEYQILWNLRIRKWLTANSYGNYDAWFEVQNWKTTRKNEKYYAAGQSGRVASFAESYWPLLDELDNDPNWDWSRFDVDGNGLLDNLIVLHSGYAAEEGGQDCTNGREYLDRIWSHAFSDSNGWRNSAGTYGVEGYMIASGLDQTCDSYPAKMGVMTHEYLHTFYLIDLYDYTFKGKGVGAFDIMAYPYGFDHDGYMPVHLSVWAKTAIDWLECEEVPSSGTYTLEPAALSPSCYRITLLSEEESEVEAAEYLLIENRQQIAFDIDFWSSGVVIYHIDDAADEQYKQGHPGQSGWPGNGFHYQVAVLQADGNYDLEKGENIGDENDMFQPGMSLTPNYDGKTHPSTDLYQKGNVKKSGVVIEVLEAEGRNFNIKITLGSRSGADSAPAVLSAPVKEEEVIEEEAKDQFHVPDAEEFRISGKIPQLPWREEQLNEKENEQSSSKRETSSGFSLSTMGILGMVMGLNCAIILL